MARDFSLVNRQKAFTLIELIIVMAVSGLLISIVGAYSFKNIDRVNRQAEIKNAQQWVEKKLFFSFIQGRATSLVFSGNRIIFQSSPTFNSAKRDSIEYQKLVLDQIEFELITFPSQEIQVSTQGLPNSALVKVMEGERVLDINLSTKVATDEASSL
ncbi:type II secretion system protein [Pseudoalteromonas xiamenensis]